MKEKIKKIIFGYGLGFILGIISACTVSVIAATYFPSNEVTYDNTKSELKSTDVQGAIDELYTECTKEPTTGEIIIENAGLEKDPYECRYFFTGADPNNYITFNNEQAGWRILSVECDGTIKIIKTKYINEHLWDSESNNWSKPASLNTYLNGTYYNDLTTTAQNQIITKNWKIGAIKAENNDLEDQINDENKTKWTGKVGLVTVSEYIRSNSNKSNCRTLSLNNSNYISCRNTNWIFEPELETSNYLYWWTINSYSNSDVFVISNTGTIAYDSPLRKYYGVTRPTLYLSSNVKIIGGDGSKSNPYTIQ